jgi:flagellar protein FliS
MHSSTFTAKNRNRLNQYLVNEITQATPKQLLIKIYDFAIVNYNKQVSEISTGLLRLYQYCQEEMRNKNYEIVYNILTELKESWIAAFNK